MRVWNWSADINIWIIAMVYKIIAKNVSASVSYSGDCAFCVGDDGRNCEFGFENVWTSNGDGFVWELGVEI